MFMKEVFTEAKPDSFDEETLTTINKFFENSLECVGGQPVSFTFTEILWYTGWRSFRRVQDWISGSLDDALTFKIAMMVVSYMKYMENQM